MLQVINISKWFGSIHAVNSISFAAKSGEVVGFLGPNGAGKSTTMKMISGFLTPDSGRALIAGIDICEHSLEAKRLIGYLPEGAPAYTDMTVAGLLNFIAEARGLKDRAKLRAIDSIISKINLEDVLGQTVDTLSKGYRRRLGLAQAILHDPPILLLDEPTDGLDPNQKHEVRALIKAMSKNKVILLSTHILEEVEAVCDRAIVIAAGKIIADSTPAELIAQSPRHDTVLVKLKHAKQNMAETAFMDLEAVKKVEVVSEHEDELQVCLHPRTRTRNRASIFEQISMVASKHKWEVLDLNSRKGHLDEVFREMTQKYQKVN